MKNKFFAPIVALLVVISLGVILFLAGGNVSPAYKEQDMPKLMLFYKNSEYTGDMKKNIRKLEKYYGKDIDIVVNNVDEDKGLLKSYPLEGNTPAVITTDQMEDVTGIYFNVTEYEKLQSIAENIKNEG